MDRYPPSDRARLRRLRLALAVFVIGLVLSGATAIPVQTQLDLLVRWAGLQDASPAAYAASAWQHWLLTVQRAIVGINLRYPFIAYGGDWLAFGHFMIALVFLWAWREPVRYRFLFDYGLLMCACVIPYAAIFGHIRGIPWWWRLIDCSFGILGALPLLLCRHEARRLAGHDPAPTAASTRA